MELDANYTHSFDFAAQAPFARKRSEVVQQILKMGDDVNNVISSIELSTKLDIESQIANNHIDTRA